MPTRPRCAGPRIGAGVFDADDGVIGEEGARLETDDSHEQLQYRDHEHDEETRDAEIRPLYKSKYNNKTFLNI